MARRPTRAREPERDTKGLRDYLLPIEQTGELRQLIVGEAEPAELTAFWERMAAEHLFDLPSLVVDHVPEEGQARYKARPVELFDGEDGTRPATEADEMAGEGEATGPNAEAQMIGSERRAESAMDDFLDTADLATLAGDLAAGMLMAFQAIHKPWDQHSQQEKRDRVAQLDSLAAKTVRGMVELMAGAGRASVKAIVDKITIGDKVSIALKMAAMSHEEQGEAIAQLFDWQKATVLLVSADANSFVGRRAELVEADEIELPFDGGDPAPAASEAEAPPSDDSDLADEDDEDEESEQVGEFEDAEQA